MDIDNVLSDFNFENHEFNNEELVEYWKQILQSSNHKPIDLFDSEYYSDVDIKLDIKNLRQEIEEIEELIEKREGKSENFSVLGNEIKEYRYKLHLLNAISTVRSKLSHDSYTFDVENLDSIDNSFEHVLRNVIRKYVEYNEDQVEELVEVFSEK